MALKKFIKSIRPKMNNHMNSNNEVNMKTFKTLFLAIAFFASYSIHAQVAITNDGSSPDGSAMLDVKSTSKGFLPPRMTYSERTSIASPVAGLIIWCTNCGASGELQVYNGSIWTALTMGTATNAVPDAPTMGTASAGNAQASVTFTAPVDNGGSTITSYTATSNPGSITGTLNQAGSGTINITGLSNGTTYTFTVTATNSVGTSAASAVSNSVTPLVVGDYYQGGVVFYLNGSGGGLICAVSDQSTETEWGCIGTDITGADGIAIGTGNQNTIDIEAGCATTGVAADFCANLTLNGYSDWFLPSIDELNQIYLNKSTIDATAVLNGGSFLGSGNYWSSTEYDSIYALLQLFNFGGPSYTANKNYSFGLVRAVRAF
ncbi:MAG: DUF1566 domain-containing protein [Bacteroidales bacterium]|nr:DUF1566 domain-containing protein [Bacteroidales bacterium]